MREMKQYMRIFRKETEDRTRYWVSVSADRTDRKGNATGEYVSANMTAYLSEDAAERFDKICEQTKNDDICTARVKVTHAWLKPIEGKEENFMVLFINDFTVEEKASSKKGGRK